LATTGAVRTSAIVLCPPIPLLRSRCPGLQDESHNGMRSVNRKLRMARLDGTCIGSAPMCVSGVSPERSHTVYDGRQSTEDLPQVLFQLSSRRESKVTLDNLPKRV
jgi:hypothetical protein